VRSMPKTSIIPNIHVEDNTIKNLEDQNQTRAPAAINSGNDTKEQSAPVENDKFAIIRNQI